MKDKYNDNKLAEEMDLIVLTSDSLANKGLPRGSIGTLPYSYTGENNPLFAQFDYLDGTRKETPLSSRSFRVVNPQSEDDLSMLIRILRERARKKA